MRFLPKVDDVDGDVVLFHFLGKSDEVLGGVFNRGRNKDYDSLFLQFILSMFESQLYVSPVFYQTEDT